MFASIQNKIQTSYDFLIGSTLSKYETIKSANPQFKQQIEFYEQTLTRKTTLSPTITENPNPKTLKDLLASQPQKNQKIIANALMLKILFSFTKSIAYASFIAAISFPLFFIPISSIPSDDPNCIINYNNRVIIKYALSLPFFISTIHSIVDLLVLLATLWSCSSQMNQKTRTLTYASSIIPILCVLLMKLISYSFFFIPGIYSGPLDPNNTSCPLNLTQ